MSRRVTQRTTTTLPRTRTDRMVILYRGRVGQLTTGIPLSAGSEVSIQPYANADHSIPRVLPAVCLTVN